MAIFICKTSYLSILPGDLYDDYLISFYILSKRLVLKYEELSDARVAPITKNKCGFAVHFFK